MNQRKYLDSSIKILKEMLGDQSNELGSEQQRAFATGIRKLRNLRKQSKINHEELYRAVSEIAEEISKVL